MEQIERIKTMQRHLDQVSQMVGQLSAALDEYTRAEASVRELSAYYGSKEWKHDFADDEAGLLPDDLKRGVLSEDGIWNVLEDYRELIGRMQAMIRTGC